MKTIEHGQPLLAAIPRGAGKDNNLAQPNQIPGDLPQSLFSEYMLLRVKSLGDNRPTQLLDSQQDYSISTAEDLCMLETGAVRYRPEDFLYVDEFGKVANNRLITLRRFPYPTFDDITTTPFEGADTHDLVRMLSYSHQEANSLKELLAFSCGMNWKELESSIEQMSMEGPREGIDGHLKSVLKYIDPVLAGNVLKNPNELSFNPYHDNNRTYGPVDTITKTHIRDRGLNFSQEFNVRFKYTARSFDGISTKAAMIDLLANAISMATNPGTFWGGARYWLGPRPTQYLSKLRELQPNSFDDLIGKSYKGLKDTAASAAAALSSKQQIVSFLTNLAKNAISVQLGQLLEKLGRPGIPYMNSLLTGSPVGIWHLTIGDPKSPILCVGNLIVTDAKFEFNDELSLDGFPTSFTVTYSLKHGQPRDVAGIESMFNSGKGRLYMPPAHPEKLRSASGMLNRTASVAAARELHYKFTQ